MLIPAAYKSNTEPTSREVSPDGQERAASMGKQSEGDNASGNSVKTLAQNSYISIHQRSSLPLAVISKGPPSSDANSNSISNNCTEEDDELTLSDGEQFGSVDDEEEEQQACTPKRRITSQGDEMGAKLKHELSKYKQELKEYNETTKDLEKKYMKINYELSEMQQKHDHFVGRRSQSPDSELPSEADADADGNVLDSYCPSDSSIGSELTVKRKSTKVFRSNTSFMTVLAAPSSCEELTTRQKRQELRQPKIRHNLTAQVEVGGYGQHIVSSRHARRALRAPSDHLEEQENEPNSFKQMYHVLKDVMNTQQQQQQLQQLQQQDHKPKYGYERDSGEFNQLYTTIKDLKTEQVQFRNIIRHQQDRITDYHTRCVKAQEIMKTQKHEIDKLQVNNKQLESSIYHDIDTLRSKIDSKLKSVAQLPHLMREEHTKYEKVLRENCLMAEKLHALQKEAAQLKCKIDELGKRKLITVNRLKAAERDLKIFKNYNAALKTEKRRLAEELSTSKLQLDSLQAVGKRQLSRHREQTEKQRRELQKRIFDLELKLSRSQNSTSSLIQERDSLIAELQTQLHTLVHNFEVSQKHIRVLRRHIYTMTSGSSGGTALGSGCAPGSSSSSPQRSCPSSEQNVMRASQQSQPSSPCVTRLSTPRTLKSRA
ncbi:cingulin [Drosophila virilis]|uniref:Uncharacterized protein n=1 Tax=Drosophila virilis TaxID=7244 RepID=B4LRU3_DROVI|nr:probable E3 ubiquitin-protein ligase bre1 [Drosophila virilis]EDW64695.1 uncharacterized protein Dvir_GJ21047 [Drosophila virilis]